MACTYFAEQAKIIQYTYIQSGIGLRGADKMNCPQQTHFSRLKSAPLCYWRNVFIGDMVSAGLMLHTTRR